MSGLVCVFSRDGAAVDAADVDAVLQRQAHRGPDGLRLWCDGQVGLGLAALDPAGSGRSTGPLVVEEGRFAVVGDLRIDNRRELIAGLDLQKQGLTDAEIVLQSYRRWGVDTPMHLVGAFAFVIWDARNRRILCVRDHLGVKPLTYHLSGKLLVCASEAEAVPEARGVPRRINEARIADFLISELEGVDHTCTFFEGVVRLPPAHILVVEPRGHRLRKYWEPAVENELHLGSDEAYAEAFAETFRQAVKSCVTGVVKPGLLLSGGIDSGAIAGVAGSLADVRQADPLSTYSAIDEDWGGSLESSCIRTMVGHLGVVSTTLSPDDIGRMPSSDRQALLECGEPFDSLMVVPGLCNSAAAENGTRVVLDGIDGDIVASTRCPTLHLLRRGRLHRVWREAAALRRLFPGAASPLQVVVGGVLRAWVPRGIRAALRKLRSRRGGIDSIFDDSLVDRDFARRISAEKRLEKLWSHGRRDPVAVPRAAHATMLTHPWVAAALERYDRVAAMRGVESRHPFFDLRLVELCLSLPWDLKVRGGWTKFVLRLAAARTVPAEICWRHDFGDVLWRPTSRVIAEERNFLRSIVRDGDGELDPYIDQARLERMTEALGGNLTGQEEVWIWEASTLARWLARIRSMDN